MLFTQPENQAAAERGYGSTRVPAARRLAPATPTPGTHGAGLAQADTASAPSQENSSSTGGRRHRADARAARSPLTGRTPLAGYPQGGSHLRGSDCRVG
jgi:hypothetical protein